MNELQECHRLVWAFRQEIEPYWATPDPLNSLRYAFCEAAEAMDAWLRAERPDDSRNNERDNDVLDELADCAIMLLTAVPEFKWQYFTDDKLPLESLDELVIDFYHPFKIGINSGYFRDSIMVMVSKIANYPGMELKQRIQGRLARIATKHAPNGIDLEIIEKLDLWQHVKTEWVNNEPPM